MSTPAKLIKFRCPCGQKLSVGEDFAGKKGRCPKCGTKFRIPTLDEIRTRKLAKDAPEQEPPRESPDSEEPAEHIHPPPPPPPVLKRESLEEAFRSNPPPIESEPQKELLPVAPAQVPLDSAPEPAPASETVPLKNREGKPLCPLCLEITDTDSTDCPYCLSDLMGQEARTVAAVLVKPYRGGRTPLQQALDDPSTKVCPQCAEMIHAMARKCKFCKRLLIGEKTGEMVKVAPPEAVVGRPHDIKKCVIFFILTLTFYGYMWLYLIGKDLRNHANRPFKAGLHAILTLITLGVWGIYVMFHYGKMMETIRRNEKLDPAQWLTVVLMVLWVLGLGGIVGTITRVFESLSIGLTAFFSPGAFTFIGINGLFILACLVLLQSTLNEHWRMHRTRR